MVRFKEPNSSIDSIHKLVFFAQNLGTVQECKGKGENKFKQNMKFYTLDKK